jgi:hypothetical protein
LEFQHQIFSLGTLAPSNHSWHQLLLYPHRIIADDDEIGPNKIKNKIINDTSYPISVIDTAQSTILQQRLRRKIFVVSIYIVIGDGKTKQCFRCRHYDCEENTRRHQQTLTRKRNFLHPKSLYFLYLV